jgi:hypothetical protein
MSHTIVINPNKHTAHTRSWGTKCFSYNSDITENNAFYNIHHCLFDTVILIYKDSDEGIKITDMIDKNISEKRIKNHVDKIVLSKVSCSYVKNFLEFFEKSSIEDGMEQKQKEIKKVLGIWE